MDLRLDAYPILPPAVLAALLSPWIMSLYGPGFREGWMILVLLLAAAPLHALSKIASGALLAMNRAWWIPGLNMVWGGTLLAVTAWLVPTRGAMGLAIAFLAAYAMLGAFSLTSVLVGSKERVAPQLVSDTADHR